MTPKEKAKELVELMESKFNYMIEFGNPKDAAKECALIAVDEMINEVISTQVPIYNYDKAYDYWNEVKQEIQNL